MSSDYGAGGTNTSEANQCWSLPALLPENQVGGFMKDSAEQLDSSELPRVLLVDDDAALLAVLERMLCFDCTLSTARDGLAALEVMEQTRFDVVVTDLRMPRMDGIELVRTASKDPQCPVFVMLTGNIENPAIRDLENDGLLSDILQKPCLTKDMLSAIETAFQVSKERAVKPL